MTDDPTHARRLPAISRRRALTSIGGIGLVALAACSSSGSSSAPSSSTTSTSGTGSTGSSSSGSSGPTDTTAADCVLTPEMTEGPYYLDGEAVRRDITEGRPGMPLRLDVTVVDVDTCAPAEGVSVEIWHCDATGDYSGFQSSNRTFLRGIQPTDGSGVATFDTIYPGWYPGRTVHIHVKVHEPADTVHTGQLFFDDGVTDAVFTSDPYATRPDRSTRNGADGIYRQGGASTLMTPTRQGDGYVAAVTLGIRRGGSASAA